jgi:NAD(P)-dependent dehydrogenase (short-subunit alcohol dehydrogenase family)
MPDRHQDNVLVTGASRGLGLETALQLAEAGFTTWAGFRDTQGSAAVEAAAAQRGVKLNPVRLDITDQESVDKAVSEISAQGRLYALINSAGITGRTYFEEFPEDFLRRIFDVNVFGTMNVTRRALPLLREAGRGRIVMISSVGGRIGSMGLAPYVASKFALEGFSESLWLEMKPFGVRVAIIEPGIINTDIWDESRRVLPPARNPRSPYYDVFWRAEREATKLVNSSRLRPSDVAKRVLEAVTAKHPRLRYVVGRRAAVAVGLRRHLPGELFERLYFGEVLRRLGAASSSKMRTSEGNLEG